jgi:hypothetical protein
MYIGEHYCWSKDMYTMGVCLPRLKRHGDDRKILDVLWPDSDLKPGRVAIPHWCQLVLGGDLVELNIGLCPGEP